jgi:F0F1-type ATP synthase assembly protein I
MKKTVVTFGLISGGVSAALMLLTVPFLDRIGFDHKGEILGYTAIVLSFLFVFFGIRSYRNNVEHGRVSFTRAFAVGILITLVSTACYVATWEVIYFKLAPGFADKYAAYAVERARASGASQQVIEQTAREMRDFKVMYDRPMMNAAITFLEPFPIGLLVTLISAVALRKRVPNGA